MKRGYGTQINFKMPGIEKTKEKKCIQSTRRGENNQLFPKNHSKPFSLYFSPGVRQQVLHTHTRTHIHTQTNRKNGKFVYPILILRFQVAVMKTQNSEPKFCDRSRQLHALPS